MTPNNILNMAMLKGLDFVAVTDHNSTKQLKTFEQLVDSYDFVFVPGVEVTVKEEFDVICLFQKFEDAYDFDTFLEEHLDGKWKSYTKENQTITDIYDLTLDYVDIPLTSTDIAYKELYNEVKKRNGMVILAHIDRRHQSPLRVYKLKDIPFDAVEIQAYHDKTFFHRHKELKECIILYNSDSHSLLSISEKDNAIELPEKTIEALFSYLGGAK